MERIVEQVKFPFRLKPKKNVAAYLRVSADKNDSIHSLIAQADYYREYISSNNEWTFIGIYADEGLTGTKDNRPEFLRLLKDCRDGKVDLVITKSISRFARNTVTLLSTVRELKLLGVDVYFEEDRIHSLSADGEIMLSLLASIAQDQSLSTSENMKWRIKKNFEQGIPWDGTLLGYRLVDGQYRIEPKEAKLVRLIFDMYLSGMGIAKICNYLNQNSYKTRLGFKWSQPTVRGILINYTYTGNLILQKTYQLDYLSKKKMFNHGELPKYHAENTHEGIVTIQEFNRTQDMLKSRSEKYYKPIPKKPYSLSGQIACANCGKKYVRHTTPTGITWMCPTYKNEGKAACPSKQIPEDVINNFIEELGGMNFIETITACNENIIVFKLIDDQEIIKKWADRSRSESWTKEKREQQSKITKEKIKCKQPEK